MFRRIGRLLKPLSHKVELVLAVVPSGMVIVLLAAACMARETSDRPYAVGQTAELNRWHITVHSFSTLPANLWHRPTEDHVFCVVELTLENHGDQIRFLMPERQMLLMDAEDRAYPPYYPAGLVTARLRNWTVPDGKMSIGETAHGAAAYEIPNNATGLHWVFCSGLLPWSPKVTFTLGEPP